MVRSEGVLVCRHYLHLVSSRRCKNVPLTTQSANSKNALASKLRPDQLLAAGEKISRQALRLIPLRLLDTCSRTKIWLVGNRS